MLKTIKTEGQVAPPDIKRIPKGMGSNTSYNVLIIGESGSGKSTSIRNLDPKETFIIRVLGKPLPFKGWQNIYNETNMETTDNSQRIRTILTDISLNKKQFKTVIIDDFQYVMANEFMRRAKEKGFDKFTEIGENAWQLLYHSTMLREDLIVIFLSHSETDDNGRIRTKTIGKLLTEKITVEGIFTVVLQTVVNDDGYNFLTKNNGLNTAKAPMGMFDKDYIPNDLQIVVESIRRY